MGVLIDTSVFIAHERGQLELSTQLGQPNEAVMLSAITASELLHGVHRADTPARAKQRSAFVEAILDRFPIVGIDVAVAREHARIWAQLSKKGTPIGAHDLWIGAQALVLEFEVLTANVREFKRVPGLKVRLASGA